ncbi:squamosa promoter-binding-like protein 1 [Chenopodium quinoa]|uniref:squamosa promoter-binding-like protein 1 n=1 Tax=Chenopodium quinoa TaxID=63459 RepID=UPI000B7829C7|nr:squamosa promoter-binding-like protein 1 [Chenopodium quinoa]XP_021756979.1 squamosa promoter-binding-like protein 1 [Chenopodium quinoa]
MEAGMGGITDVYSSAVLPVSDPKAVGKKTLEWDLNDWKWDGDLFLATPLNTTHTPLDCRSKQLFPLGPELAMNNNVGSEEISITNEKGKREMEKRRRVVVVPHEELNEEGRPLNLKLGEQVYPIAEDEADKLEGKSVKKSRSAGTGTSQPACQVEGCMANLSNAKDYHRRHKVCEVHSKVSEAFVRNVMQRFCQQCSRFHALPEFDEGKRSCRRRLAGHNKRRRKTLPETSPNVGSLTDEKSAGYLLVSLLRILSNLHSNGSDETKDQDLISHLLRNLASQVSGSNLPELQQGSQRLLNAGISVGIPEKNPSSAQELCQAVPSAEAHIGLLTRENQHQKEKTQYASQPGIFHPADGSIATKGSVPRAYLGIDLNNVYDDSQECVDIPGNGHGSIACAYWPEHLQKSSPPQTSGISDSNSGHSSSSGSDSQGRTDRIVFKLFGKDPDDLPHQLRTQILDWLSHKPSDIEGYIRPGCIVLTIYLRLNKSLWEELCYDMSSSLSRLLSLSDDPFWKTGWIYTRVQQSAAFICDGRVVLDTPLPFKSRGSQISSISPIAVPAAQTVQLVVKGSNLSGPTSRLLCAIEGRYLVQDSCYSLVESTAEQDEVQSLSFHCSIPNVVGRGFIEVEDYGLSGCFFPFIVAEPEICSEICMLERVMETVGTDEGINRRNDALEFIHEMGWLLHADRLSSMSGQPNIQLDLFPFVRLKWLIDFSMDHDWSAVLRKLLDLLFSGIVDTGNHASVKNALSEMPLLHTAVQRNSRSMVEFLLRYIPKKVKNTKGSEQKQSHYEPPISFLFRPDVTGSNGLTPLHLAASCAGFENILDALLEDPGMVGIGAWENARDSTGLTPKDYAYLRGHNHYIVLFQSKVNKISSGKHVVVDILGLSNLNSKQKQSDELKSAKFNSLYTEKRQISQNCKLCVQRPNYGFRGTSLTCRPVVMSLVTIAVVCVCTALLFKSMPRVCYIFVPFRWDSLKYGAV